MRMLQTNDLSRLLSVQAGPCVSVYLDTKASGRDPKSIQKRWKGLLGEADALIKQNVEPHRARFLLEPMRGVPEILMKSPGEMEGVALFRSFTTAGYFPVKESTSDLVTVSDTFHLKPLLKKIQEQERYFALALSQRRISLYEGGRDGARLVAAFDADYDDGKKHKARRKLESISIPRGREGRDAVIHFRPLDRVSRFVELTEPHIWTLLHRESVPLILVGTPFMHRIYRNMNCYPYLSENGVAASLPHRKDVIHERTWPIAERIFVKRELDLCERYFEEKQRDKASNDLHEIGEASLQGRVSTLLVSKGAHRFGVLNRAAGKIELRDSASGALGDDVLDDIAQEVIMRKGEAFVFPPSAMPTESPIAALYRW